MFLKIEDWKRTVNRRRKIVWKHDTGVSIMLSPATMKDYKLILYDKAGREKFRVYSPNKTKLEHKSSQWQKDYNRYLSKKSH